MSLLYSYLVATRKISLPTSSDQLYADDSEEIDQVLDEMRQLLTRERSFIRDVYNTGIEFIRNKEAEIIKQEEQKKQNISVQAKKIAKAKMISKM